MHRMRNYYHFLSIFFLLPFFFLTSNDLLAQCPNGDLQIFSQASVTNFKTAYPNCTTISGNLIINDSADIVVVNGVDTYNADITSLAGLSSIKVVTGSLNIRSCSQLKSFVGLDSITSIGADLYIIENDHADLKSFSGLGNLATIPNSITIRLNDNLESLSGLATVTGALTGQIKITDNPKLGSITPLNGITSTGSDVIIKRNKLLNLSGLENIKTIGGFLNVREEPALTSIALLASLTSVGNNTLNISDNPLLTTLDGLQNVTSIDGSLYISNNTKLGDCDAVCPILLDSLATSFVVGGNKVGSTCQYLTALQAACQAALPIELTYFSSRHDASQVYLEWETSSELNSAGQYVEKSQNGRDWEDIAWIEGSGTTQDLHDYHFKDRMPYDGINYYRLKQVDYDGKVEYSHVISEYFTRKGQAGVQMYPNPVKDLLFIQHQLQDQAKVTIFDVYGKLVLSVGLNHAVDVSNLPEGVYYVKVYDEFEVLPTQVIVVRP